MAAWHSGAAVSGRSATEGALTVLADNGAQLRSVSSPEQPRPLRSTGITPLQRYYGPLRLLTRHAPVFGFALCGALADRPRCHVRSPQLRLPSVSTCRPVDPAQAHGLPAVCCMAHSVECQPSPDAQRFGLGGVMFRGSYGFTGVTARRFAAAAPLAGPATEPGVLERGGRPPPPRRALHAEQTIGVEGSFHPSRRQAPSLGIRAS
jgi:hypothetical protein